jgi:parallel beta-helix repeat protein
MKTLDQVEARTIVNAANTPGDATNTYIISAPGSYYLAGNITGAAGKHGISIRAHNVTLDLNGFALISGGAEVTRGVDTLIPIVNFSIRNGSVRGWTDGGVRAEFAVTLAEKLRLSENARGPGLAVGNGSLVKDCVASENGVGFYCPDRSQISNCIATVNKGDGFNCTAYVNLIDCTSSRNGGNGITTLEGCSIIRCSATRNLPFGYGIDAGSNCTIVNCTASNNGASGIFARNGCNITDCTAGTNGAYGIRVDNDNTVRGCVASANGNAGIHAASMCHIIGNTCNRNQTGITSVGRGSRIEGNYFARNTAYGLGSFGDGYNLIIRNTAFSNAENFVGIANDMMGPYVIQTGGTLETESPWINFIQ